MRLIGRKENGLYYGDYNGEGYIFKDEDAFRNRKDEICYIAEAGFCDNDPLSEDEAKAEIEKGGAETYNSMFEFAKSALQDEFGAERITDEFVANCIEYMFLELQWTCFSTFMEEIDFAEDLEHFENTGKFYD